MMSYLEVVDQFWQKGLFERIKIFRIFGLQIGLIQIGINRFLNFTRFYISSCEEKLWIFRLFQNIFFFLWLNNFFKRKTLVSCKIHLIQLDFFLA